MPSCPTFIPADGADGIRWAAAELDAGARLRREQDVRPGWIFSRHSSTKDAFMNVTIRFVKLS